MCLCLCVHVQHFCVSPSLTLGIKIAFGVGVIVPWIWSLPCTQPTWVPYLAPNMVPKAHQERSLISEPGISSEHYSFCLPFPQKQKPKQNKVHFPINCCSSKTRYECHFFHKAETYTEILEFRLNHHCILLEHFYCGITLFPLLKTPLSPMKQACNIM